MAPHDQRSPVLAFLLALLGVVIGMALAFALVIAVELFSAVVHPMPPDFDGNIPEHVRRYPHWVLGVVVLFWGATGAAATWVASRIGGRAAGAIVALLLLAALLFNLSLLPYVIWFKVMMPLVLAAACLVGIRYGKRPAPAPVLR